MDLSGFPGSAAETGSNGGCPSTAPLVLLGTNSRGGYVGAPSSTPTGAVATTVAAALMQPLPLFHPVAHSLGEGGVVLGLGHVLD